MEIKAVCVLKDEHDVYPHPHNLQDPVSGVAGTIAFESQDTNCCLDTYDEYHRTNAVNTYVISIEDTAHKNGTVLIKGIITGLTHGKHGLHVCAFGNLFNGYHSIGPHFNPRKKTHGGQQDEERVLKSQSVVTMNGVSPNYFYVNFGAWSSTLIRHVGDLGNVEANEEGVAEFQVEDHLVSLSGTESIIGRAVVIRAEEDDLGKGGNEESLITGNATTGLAWGVIGIAEVVAK